MHFASAQRVGEKMWDLIHEAKPNVLVLDRSAVPDIEYTALKMLAVVAVLGLGTMGFIAGLKSARDTIPITVMVFLIPSAACRGRPAGRSRPCSPWPGRPRRSTRGPGTFWRR